MYHHGSRLGWQLSPSVGSGTFLQWLACIHVVLSAIFTVVCVVRSTWNGPRQRLECQCFLLRSFITTQSPGWKSWSDMEAGGGRADFTCWEIWERVEDKFLQYCNIPSSHRPVEGSGLDAGSTPKDGGLPKRISKGLMFALDLFLILMCVRTIGRAFVLGSPVSSQHFANLDFRVPFSRSTAPPLAGWYAQCCLRSMTRNLLIWVIAELTECVPLSLLSLVGIPHLGMISVNKAFATTWLFWCFAGNTSTHFDHNNHVNHH